MLLLFTMGARAAETVIWQGSKSFASWSDVLNIEGRLFSQTKADDVLHLSITASAGAQLQLSWENMQKDGALWLMVAPWCGGGAFDHGNTPEFWQQFLSEENVISRGK